MKGRRRRRYEIFINGVLRLCLGIYIKVTYEKDVRVGEKRRESHYLF